MVKLMILSKTEGAAAPGAKGDSAAPNDRSCVDVELLPEATAVRNNRLQVKRNAIVSC